MPKRDRAAYMKAYRAKVTTNFSLNGKPVPKWSDTTEVPVEVPVTLEDIGNAIARLTQADRDAILRRLNKTGQER